MGLKYRASAEIMPGFVAGLVLLGFARNLSTAINKSFMFALVASYTESPLVRGIVLSIEGLVGMILPLLIGYYSDKALLRGEGRDKIIFLSGIVAGLSLIFLYQAYAFSMGFEIFVFFVSLFYSALHAYTVQLKALMPELVEKGHRGKISGLMNASQLIGTLVGTMGGAFLWSLGEGYPFLLAGIVVVLGTLLGAKEVRTSTTPQARKPEPHVLLKGEFLKFYASQFLMFLGYEVVTVFFMGAVAFILHGSADSLIVKRITPMGAMFIGFFGIMGVLGALMAGSLYDKADRKKVVALGAFTFSLPLMLGLMAENELHILAALALAGFGWGVLLTATYPLMADMLSLRGWNGTMGTFYGIYELLRSFPLLVAATVGGIVIELFGGDYRVILPFGGIVVIFSALMIWMIEKI